MARTHYYYSKYPYFNYNYRDVDGIYTMFSIPPEMLALVFLHRTGYIPKTFFDCGVATGEIVYRAQQIGMDAQGIDIRKYPYQNDKLAKLFINEKIQIKSILECGKIKSDIVYCNGTLTYFSEHELTKVLDNFSECQMLFAIHNTSEDVETAAKQHDISITCDKPRLIRSRDWWINTFMGNGFQAEYFAPLQCFLARPVNKR